MARPILQKNIKAADVTFHPRFTREEVWAELDRHYGQMYRLLLRAFRFGYAGDVRAYLEREKAMCQYCGSPLERWREGQEYCERCNAPTPHWWARLEGVVHG